MATERKEKLIRVLQILETTDKKTPINATSIVEKLENEYNVGKVDRRSIYRDIAMLQSCGYKIEQAKDKRKGWYLDKHAFEDWEIKIMMDAVQQARCVSEKEAADIREKLLKLTSNRGRSRFSHMMLISFCPLEVRTSLCFDRVRTKCKTFFMYIHSYVNCVIIHLMTSLCMR